MNSEELIELASRYDTPTMCNAMDIVFGTRTATGFTRSPVVTAQTSNQPIVGFAKTAKIRASSPPVLSQEKINEEISDKERYLLSYKIDTLREINK